MPSREICPLCRQDLTDITLGPKCLDCSRIVCLKCGHHLPAGPEGKVCQLLIFLLLEIFILYFYRYSLTHIISALYSGNEPKIIFKIFDNFYGFYLKIFFSFFCCIKWSENFSGFQK
jgi:hypothetical protein